ncbi:transcription elongation factor A N-terminal and central domain-containing protein isoform X1 [Oxyura jamaicensis]|uniref:transcription elongation factor A N-terminal and central domain-containing protein isoform X1 n=1 Tax=Oxyura jamaicensis TaxID=8884 RepID=UPI0015A60735|nr:transcription elongation factor A N-terminal and central domain-containing protein isoform X1 [Oxyura jamaicensis]XP_035186872.1 transcription elongation factor A N-terminal and central domain-containing protein isoform X1 [Oxyura jamaicensis]XP_035186955.1 transcription elongation factor A N-terminal and central domain-containing protein isoform X1 [Oxyura jamaicensis]XP_035187037.1 transcription elongation factor A N-terminal and central domain-containing protein isoform X1 [Oxyura jamaicen
MQARGGKGPRKRAHCIEKLLSGNNFQDIEGHLKELEDVDMTIEYLQGTEVTKAVYRVLKSCPSVELKKKAKRLLSKWKALYKNNCVQSVQVKSVSGNVKEEIEHLSGTPREQLLSEGPSQQEVLNTAPSQVLVPSQTVKNVVCNDPEGSLEQLSPFEEQCIDNKDSKPLVNEASLQQDHMRALRCKCADLLYKAMSDSAKEKEETDKWLELSKEIEEHIFALHSKNDRKYKNCIRSKISNLKNPKSSHLKCNLFSGTLSPKAFAEMTVMEMASDELKQLRALYTESSVQEHQLPQVINGTQTNKIKCRRCEKFDCTITMIARGTLFLPGWVRNTNPDEQMLTYIICNECGEQWYHSRWICL